MDGGKHRFMDMQLSERSVFTKTEIFVVVVVAGVLVCTWKGNVLYIRYRSGCEQHQNVAPPPFKEELPSSSSSLFSLYIFSFFLSFFFFRFGFSLFSRLLCFSGLRGAPYLSLFSSLQWIRENDVL